MQNSGRTYAAAKQSASSCAAGTPQLYIQHRATTAVLAQCNKHIRTAATWPHDSQHKNGSATARSSCLKTKQRNHEESSKHTVLLHICCCCCNIAACIRPARHS
eukprot:GHRQ01016397.1.p2 GENE.GHRQ01016397.1~~GHRQ01016397.1.p2  ORF type:complete len:104 (-),score=11.77 GHRQ01016397.1:525-836(-)